MSNPTNPTNGGNNGASKGPQPADFNIEPDAPANAQGGPAQNGAHGHADHDHANPEPQPMPTWQMLVLLVIALLGFIPGMWFLFIIDVGLGLYFMFGTGVTKGDAVKLASGAAALVLSQKEHGATHGGGNHGHSDSHGHGGGGGEGGLAAFLNIVYPPPPPINPDMMGIITAPPHGTTGIHHEEVGMTHVIMNLRDGSIFPDGVGAVVPVGHVPVRQGHMIAAFRGFAECVAVVDHSEQTQQLAGATFNPHGVEVIGNLGYSVQPIISPDGHVSAGVCKLLLTKIDKPLQPLVEQMVKAAMQASFAGKSLTWILDAANNDWMSQYATAHLANALRPYGLTGKVTVESLSNVLISRTRALSAVQEAAAASGADPAVIATLAAGFDPTGSSPLGGGQLGVSMAPGTQHPTSGSRKAKFVRPGKGKDDSGKKKND